MRDLTIAHGPSARSSIIPVSEERNANILRGDLDLPVLVMKRSAVAHNIRLMSEYCAHHGVELCPHGKTSMTPWLFAQQLDGGAWGLTAATPEHVRVYRALGVTRILLANVLVEPRAIEWIVRDLQRNSEVEFLCYVESEAGIVLLEETLSKLDSEQKIDVLIEQGYPGGRTGVRGVARAIDLAERVASSTHLRLRGVSGFEGFFSVVDDPEGEALCRSYLEEIHRSVSEIHARGLVEGPLLLSIGGSTYFDIALEHLAPARFSFDMTVVLRSGCYVAHDSGMYEELSPLAARGRPMSVFGELKAALELWCTVWSLPEPGLAIVGFGRRDAPFDHSMPVALRAYRNGEVLHGVLGGQAEVVGLNDQHAFLRYKGEELLRIGDTLVFGVSHPCGAFDKWRWIPVVTEEYDVQLFAGTLF